MALDNEQTSVGIIGCGWLGHPLAKTLLKQHASVIATRSSAENTAVLGAQGIDARVLLLPASTAESVLALNQHPVFSQQSLLIAITPQFRQGRTDYSEKIGQLVNAAREQGCVNRIILLSSTAAYNGLCGDVNETSSLNFLADKVQILNEAEQAVLGFACPENNRKSYVLRLAGLVGPGRHPGKFIKSGRLLSSSLAPVNLIHQEDALGLILSLLTTKTDSGIFNGVSQTHVSKKDYYRAAAKALSLPMPSFSDDAAASLKKIVSGVKAEQILSYQFVYPDLLTWL